LPLDIHSADKVVDSPQERLESLSVFFVTFVVDESTFDLLKLQALQPVNNEFYWINHIDSTDVLG